MTIPNAERYMCFADLASAQVEGKDFQVIVELRESATVAIVAPHGGSIEAHTSAIARGIAGDDFSLYLLEGLRGAGNYRALHLTSAKFDEPRCLQLIAPCEVVLTVHGCRDEGRRVLLGGLDQGLKSRVAKSLQLHGVTCQATNHPYPGKDPTNICNRGCSGIGVQLELTMGLRRSAHLTSRLIAAVRAVLLDRV